MTIDGEGGDEESAAGVVNPATRVRLFAAASYQTFSDFSRWRIGLFAQITGVHKNTPVGVTIAANLPFDSVK
jgi:hypothetical protein